MSFDDSNQNVVSECMKNDDTLFRTFQFEISINKKKVDLSPKSV